MLDQHPILRERLLAAATFALILIGGAASLDFLVTNGLQWGSDPRPPSVIQLTLQAGSPTDRFAPYSSQALNEPDYSRDLADEPLEGAGDQTDARHASASRRDEDLHRAIDDLYAAAIVSDGEGDTFDKGGPASEDAYEERPVYENVTPW